MAPYVDPQVAEGWRRLQEATGSPPPAAVGDVQTRRERSEASTPFTNDCLPLAEGLRSSPYSTRAQDGTEIPLWLFEPVGAAKPGGPIALYIHGGGMILGSVAQYDRLLRLLVARSGVALLAVEYRLAPEHPHPVPVEDCYAALRWLSDHAAELGYDPNRLAVIGDSAGAGLAAATALLARDRGGPALTRQILIYPMLDDRNTVAPAVVPDPLPWNYDDNATGWSALLGEEAGGDEVPATAAPARAHELAGLPPTYLMVGDIDIFLQEDLDYGARLAAAGVPVEMHVHPGACHGFEVYAHTSEVAQRAFADEVRALRSI